MLIFLLIYQSYLPGGAGAPTSNGCLSAVICTVKAAQMKNTVLMAVDGKTPLTTVIFLATLY